MGRRIRISLALAALLASLAIIGVELGFERLAEGPGGAGRSYDESLSELGAAFEWSAGSASDGATEDGAADLAGETSATRALAAADFATEETDAAAARAASATTADVAAAGRAPVVAGIVLSAADEPLAGAQVVLVPDAPQLAGLPAAARLAVTGASGRFEVELPLSGAAWTIAASHAGGCAVRLALGPVLEDRRDLALSLGMGTFLAGTVARLEAGRAVPAPDAFVRISPAEEGDAVLVARCDDDGAFVAEGIRPGLHRVAILAPGCAVWRRAIAIPPEGSELVAELAEGSALIGRTVDERGLPVPGAIVIATSAAGVRRTAEADLAGEFFLETTEAGPVELLARARGYAARTVRASAPTEDTIVIDLAAPAECAGTVVAARSGLPIEGAAVIARPRTTEGSPAFGAPSERAASDAFGDFCLDLDPRRPWELRVDAPGFEPWVRAIEPGEWLAVELLDGAALAARFHSAGEPVEGALVRLESRAGETIESGSTDADGRVRFAAVPPEAERLRVTHSRTLAEVFPLPRVAPGREAVFELSPAGSVRGTVLYDAEIAGALTLEGAPFEAAPSVPSATAPPGTPSPEAGGRAWRTWPDAAGAFEFRSLAPGSYALRYTPRPGVPPIEQVLVIGAGATVETTIDARGM